MYRGNDYVWQVTQPPAAAVSSLKGPLEQLVGITINDSAYQVGYCYRAADQNIPPDNPNAPNSNNPLYALQNLSVLTDPGSRLKFSQIGFTNQPAIGYTPSVNDPDAIDQIDFILDPRGGGMNLRRVTLSDGSNNFGLTTKLPSWGSFPIAELDAIAVHPSNVVIGVSWKLHKMFILSLPDKPSPDASAPTALLVSGKGVRQGLMQGPIALAVAPDGRLLVLETINQRIQAFDTVGDPVPSFTPEPPLFTMSTSSIAAELDGGTIPAVLQQAFEDNAVTFLFPLNPSLASDLEFRGAPAGGRSGNQRVLPERRCFDV